MTLQSLHSIILNINYMLCFPNLVLKLAASLGLKHGVFSDPGEPNLKKTVSSGASKIGSLSLRYPFVFASFDAWKLFQKIEWMAEMKIGQAKTVGLAW